MCRHGCASRSCTACCRLRLLLPQSEAHFQGQFIIVLVITQASVLTDCSFREIVDGKTRWLVQPSSLLPSRSFGLCGKDRLPMIDDGLDLLHLSLQSNSEIGRCML